MRTLIALSLLLLAVLPAWAAERIDPRREYAECMALASRNPEQGFERAGAWLGLGGGEPARHCAAVALIGLKHYDEAAHRLEVLAQESKREPELRAGMLEQAAQAWLLAEQNERAVGALTAALKLMPDDVDLRIDRAVAFAGAGRIPEAVADLDQAIAKAPNRPEPYVLRASAKRRSGNLDGALKDVDSALSLTFDQNADALLERGLIRQARGDAKGAQQDWLKAAQIAPDSLTAEAAREKLQSLEAHKERKK